MGLLQGGKMKLQWKKADEFTKDCFNKWGYNPYNAILTISRKNTNGVRYDATILKHDNGSFIPCHGGVKLEAVAKMKTAKDVLNNWIADNT
jgi:hypothetical protein